MLSQYLFLVGLGWFFNRFPYMSILPKRQKYSVSLFFLAVNAESNLPITVDVLGRGATWFVYA